MIRVRHLVHRRGKARVLDDVSLGVDPGEVLGLVGPNGAGKSALLRVLATLEEPTAGRVEVCGADVVRDPAAVRRSIGYLPDRAGFTPGGTAREHLGDYASAYGVDEAVVDGVLELVDLLDRAGHEPARLSPGEQRRLHLARILLHDPAVLLLDDPAVGLDPRARADLADLLSELARLGRAVVLAASALADVTAGCTRAAVLAGGRLIGSLEVSSGHDALARDYLALTDGGLG